MEISVNRAYDKKYEEGFPLLIKEWLVEFPMMEGEIFHLFSSKGQFIAKGYLGQQNKGLGWVLTPKESEPIDETFFMNRLIVAMNKRKKFFYDEKTTAFRLFNGEGDGIGGVTIDCYGGYYLFNWYSKGIYRFREMILGAFERIAVARGIYEKRRFDDGDFQEDWVKGRRAPKPLVVLENGVKIGVDLDDGLMTGIFLDQREVRKRIMESYARDARVLNTFSYTGLFSLFALLGGAGHTVSVDLANRSYPRTVEQLSLNGIDHESQDILVQDVFHYFKFAQKNRETFDLIILDPPSYAKSRDYTFKVQKDYPKLLKESLGILAPGGVIVAATNQSSYAREAFRSMIEKTFETEGFRAQIIESFELPEDFKRVPDLMESDYLKVFFIKRGL
ncbi:MAG: 50S rRNA methyltransferase [delta proteobacterium ML8_F1]|nr:MAG: 50S rRNA methyltransferase [delta proteobacterium ML8_F1]